MTTLQKQLFELQDLKYRDFHAKLLPGIDKETIIGILVHRSFGNSQKTSKKVQRKTHSCKNFPMCIMKKIICI